MAFDRPPAFVYRAVRSDVRFGAGLSREISPLLDELGAARVLFVATAAGAARGSAVQNAIGARLAGVFAGAEPHCPQPVVERVVAAYRETGADAVVAVGGGSTIGLAKILRAEHGAKSMVLPTTYSGSEITPIFGRKIDGQKRTRVDRAAIPDLVVYDPELTLSLPAHQTAATAMNSLAHAVEALYPAMPHPMARAMAIEAMRLHHGALPICLSEPGNVEARADVLYAGFLGGLLVSMVGVALHHALGHVLGGLFEIEHGDYNSAVLPHVAAYNGPAVAGLAEAVCGVFGGDDPGTALSDFADRIGAPTSLETLGMPVDGIPAAVAAILARAPRNPRPIDAKAMTRLITACHAGEPAHESLYLDPAQAPTGLIGDAIPGSGTGCSKGV